MKSESFRSVFAPRSFAFCDPHYITRALVRVFAFTLCTFQGTFDGQCLSKPDPLNRSVGVVLNMRERCTKRCHTIVTRTSLKPQPCKHEFTTDSRQLFIGFVLLRLFTESISVTKVHKRLSVENCNTLTERFKFSRDVDQGR